MSTQRTFAWAYAALPHIDRAGHWPLDDRGFEHAYLSRTHALHIYDYAADVRIGAFACRVHPGDVTITPAGIESRSDLARPDRHWCVHFIPTDAAGAAVLIPLHQPLGALYRHVIDAVRRIAGLLTTPAGSQRSAAEAAAAAMLLEVLLELSAWPRAGQGPPRSGGCAAPGREPDR